MLTNIFFYIPVPLELNQSKNQMRFKEDLRVKIPSILHLTRLGYKYLSLKHTVWNKETNIFTDIFIKSIQKINHDLEVDEAKRLLLVL